MIRKILQVLSGADAATPVPIEEERRTDKSKKLLDVAHEAIIEEDGEGLKGLIRLGGPNAERQRFKGKVRKKVWDTVKDEFGFADEAMVDEITDRIDDVATADPRYEKLFDSE